MIHLVSFLVFILTFCLPLNANPENTLNLYEEQQLLKSELKLAKTKHIYFVFDLRVKRVFIKSTGITLKEMVVEDVRFWGKPIEPVVHILHKKSSLVEPKREKIEPKKETEEEDNGKFEIKALELSDMPKRYRLTLSQQTDPGRVVVITVRPVTKGFISTIQRTLSLIGWYISRPFITIWYYFKNSHFTSVYLTLQEEDVRSIYWSFTEGGESIIYNP